jgi:glycosyltransferase involved in cell wall biosynthesis
VQVTNKERRTLTEPPAVSILTPTRDRAATFLPQAIASVRALQLSVPYEHVIVDDGSCDGTADYLAAEAAADPHLKIVRHRESRGVAAARNSALAAARGAIVADLDDDDLLTVAGVETRLRYLAGHPERWAVHANALRIDEEGRYLIGADVQNRACDDPAACLLLFHSSAMIPNASTGMFRRAALLELGGWDATLSCCEDYDLWLRGLLRFGPPGFVDAIVALYRVKERSLGIDSVRSGAHDRNQQTVQTRIRALAPPGALQDGGRA